MAVHGPDSGYSWVIVVCCAYIHFAFFGLFRSAGVMYVAMLQNYDVRREAASWPFALCAAVFQLIGPAVSVLTHYVSQRKACLLGSAIATVGIASCYFAESVMWITIFYGVVHGLGFGLVVTLVPVTLNQYFVKHRATAIGMAFSGGTISSLIFPAAMEWMLEAYSLKESFLLLSGVVMNTLVASALLRTPPWLENSRDTKTKLLEEGSDAKDSGVSTSDDNNTVSKEIAISTVYRVVVDERTEKTELSEKNVVKNNSAGDQSSLNDAADNVGGTQHDRSASNTDETSSDNANFDTVYSNNDSVLFDGSETRVYTVDKFKKSRNSPKIDHFDLREPDVEKPLMKERQIRIVPKQKEALEEHRKIGVRAFHSITSILKQPIFHLLTFTMCVYFLGVHSFFMVIVDFAKDKGIPESKGIYIISVFSLTDLIGRAGLGWVTDRNYIRRKTMVALNLSILGFLYQLYPLINSLTAILVVAAINGLAVGSSITLFFVLQAECMGMKSLTLVVGLTSFINGMMSLLRPGIIGLFRDVIGSYNWMFHFVGIIALIFAVIWFVESWRTKDSTSPNRVQDGKA